MIAAAFHIHTRHSFDSFTHPRWLVERAVRLGLHTLAITDHDTMAGALEAQMYAASTNVNIIVGAEYATDLGDIIGLFLAEEIKSRNAFEVIEAMHAQGGLSILPHPFHHHKQIEALASAVDMIEIFNARIRPEQNEKAAALAAKINKPTIVGSDAHFLNEVDNAITFFDVTTPFTKTGILSATQQHQLRYTSAFKTQCSQLVKGVKKRDWVLLRRQLYYMIAERAIMLRRKWL